MPNDVDYNPLDPTADVDQRIRERAYHLWQSEGCLDGRDQEYWERARELEAIRDSGGAGLLPVDTGSHADEAAIQGNLGEFPDRLSDQGERRATPMTRADLRRNDAAAS